MAANETDKERKDVFLRLPEPVNCHLWARQILSMEELDFEMAENYVDSSHFSRSLLRCKRCGQLYYQEFYEIVNWEGGDECGKLSPSGSNSGILTRIPGDAPLALERDLQIP